MSEGVFVVPRVGPAPTAALPNNNYLYQFAKSVAFGTAGLVVTAKAGRVYKVSVVNSSAIRYFLQIHDKATAPVNAGVPVWETSLPASDGADLDFGLGGFYVSLGFNIAISSTKGALTLAVADDCTAYALYATAP